MQHLNRIDNPACAPLQCPAHDSTATTPVNRTQRLEFATSHRNNAVGLRAGLQSFLSKLRKQSGMQQRHIAGNNQVPIPGELRIQGSFDTGKRPASHSMIGNHREAQVPVKRGIAHQSNFVRNLFQLPCNTASQRSVIALQKSLVAAHSEAFATHQNKARQGSSPIHQEMISFQHVTRRQRFAPCSLFAVLLVVPVLQAEPVATRTTVVVRTDARTGRLVRSVVVTPRPVVLQASLSLSSPSSTSTLDLPPQPALSGSISDLIDAIAERNQVEAPLVHSVIKAESNYNPGAISPKGAQGLMQLIPSTAHRFGVSNSFDIQQNIEGGVKYLKFLIELYNNDYRKVIAAYNAGEGAVAKYGGIPPYSETINYVYRVGKNLKAAREFAELKAADRKAKSQPVQTAALKTGDEPHSIQAVTGDDGRIYYKTQ